MFKFGSIPNDVVYFAYSVPYTYTQLINYLARLDYTYVRRAVLGGLSYFSF